MGIAVIGKFYKEKEDAGREASRMTKLWSGRVRFHVVSYPNGNLVLPESVIRKVYPDIFPKKITKRNYKGKLSTPKRIPMR